MINVFFFLDVPAALGELWRVLVPHGRVVIHTPMRNRSSSGRDRVALFDLHECHALEGVASHDDRPRLCRARRRRRTDRAA
jgi:hypothetical protein